ncbi:uncharacterized protein TRIVIDRAFT_121878, partial [Trichoderma virens Gv29-8]
LSNPDNYTTSWIYAITTEYAATRTVFDEKRERPEIVSTNNNNEYLFGKVEKHNVVIAISPDGD